MLDEWQYIWNQFYEKLAKQVYSGEITREKMHRCLDRGQNLDSYKLIILARLYGIYINYDK